MTWKITQTKDPRWIAVLSAHYDYNFNTGTDHKWVGEDEASFAT